MRRCAVALQPPLARFSALQRAEIAEIVAVQIVDDLVFDVSVLFNEPKLLKYAPTFDRSRHCLCFSALQRAEIAEIRARARLVAAV